MRQFDPKLTRARSTFEGVSTPRNEWIMRLRTKTALEQASSTRTSKREGQKSRHYPRGANAMTGVYVPIMYMVQRSDGPRVNLQRFCELIP